MALLIGNSIRRAGTVTPRATAATLDDDIIDYGTLDAQSNQIAHVLRGLGVGHRYRIVWWGETSIEALPIFGAVAKIGAVFAPLNARYGAAEAERVAGYARPRLVITDAVHRELADGWDVEVLDHATLYGRASGAATTFIDEPALDERDPHVVFFTSGSTGRPKGVVLSHRVNYLRTHPGALIAPRGAMVCPFPLFHMAGWTIALQQWHGRDRVVFMDTADAGAICDAVERHRATRLYGIPAVWRRVLDHLASPEGSGRDMSTLRFADTGTSATPPELLTALERAFPAATIRVFYGSTEAGGVATLDHADMHRKPGSCGVPALATEVRIDETGELWARGALLFDGYFDDP